MGVREIIFKAKRIDNGEWVEGSLIDSGNHEQVFIYPHYNGASTMPCRNLVYHRMIAVDVETICQYTGLTGKNGKKFGKTTLLLHILEAINPDKNSKSYLKMACFCLTIHAWKFPNTMSMEL